MNDELKVHNLKLIMELARQALSDIQAPSSKGPNAETYGNTPLLFKGEPSNKWLQSATDWPRFNSVRVANATDAFESDEYKDKFRPGETMNIYRAGCPGQRRVALLTHIPAFKIVRAVLAASSRAWRS